jgi:hypothetical protein
MAIKRIRTPLRVVRFADSASAEGGDPLASGGETLIFGKLRDLSGRGEFKTVERH